MIYQLSQTSPLIHIIIIPYLIMIIANVIIIINIPNSLRLSAFYLALLLLLIVIITVIVIVIIITIIMFVFCFSVLIFFI